MSLHTKPRVKARSAHPWSASTHFPCQLFGSCLQLLCRSLNQAWLTFHIYINRRVAICSLRWRWLRWSSEVVSVVVQTPIRGEMSGWGSPYVSRQQCQREWNNDFAYLMLKTDGNYWKELQLRLWGILCWMLHCGSFNKCLTITFSFRF